MVKKAEGKSEYLEDLGKIIEYNIPTIKRRKSLKIRLEKKGEKEGFFFYNKR